MLFEKKMYNLRDSAIKWSQMKILLYFLWATYASLIDFVLKVFVSILIQFTSNLSILGFSTDFYGIFGEINFDLEFDCKQIMDWHSTIVSQQVWKMYFEFQIKMDLIGNFH